MNFVSKLERLKINAIALLTLLINCTILPCLAETPVNRANAAANSGDTGSPLEAYDNETVDQRIESLTRQIARLELELIRLNTNFRIECTSTGKWKPWRMFLYNLGASGSCFAGSTSITATRWHYWNRSNAIPISTASAGPTLLLIGHCVVLAGVLTETALDFVHDGAVRQKGLDLNSSHKRVLEIKSTSDRLMAERDALLAQLPSAASAAGSFGSPHSRVIDKEIAVAEGEVLKDVQSLALKEYEQFFVRAHKFFSTRDANTILALVAGTSGGFSGSLPGIISAAQRRPRVVGVGGIGFPVSGATIVASPIVARLMAQRSGKSAYKQITSQWENLKVRSVLQLDKDKAKLEQLVGQREGADREKLTNIARRLTAYSRQSLLFTAQEQMTARENALADRELRERMIFSSGIGGSKISWGVNLANAGFGFHKKGVLQLAQGSTMPRFVASPLPGRLFTKRVAIGATTYLPGTSLWLLDTFQNRVNGELRDRALARQKIHPTLLLKERLNLVQEIDDVFNY
jgi:uncharacterized small protein (DUF1192 family)